MFFVQIEDETQVSRPTQAEQDHYEMHVRAANIVCIYCIPQFSQRAILKMFFKIIWNKLLNNVNTTILELLSSCLFTGYLWGL